MCDYFDDFEDDFDEGEFMDDDTFEDSLDGELDDPFAGDSEFEDETDPAESQDSEFTAKDAFIVGGAMGYAYHEGLREAKRRKRRRFRDDSD
jgi:hypothetical protein